MKSYVTNTINLSWDKILLPSVILLPKYIKYFSRAVVLLESCVLVWDGQKLWGNVQEQMPELWPVCLLHISHFPETLLVCKQQSTEVELWCTVLDINICVCVCVCVCVYIYHYHHHHQILLWSIGHP